jgi:acetolactate synthase I/II/III large subunit
MQVCSSLARHYSEEVRVVFDGGDFVHWPRLYLQAKASGHWMDGAEIGALGASLPVGIGAQLGSPARQTWVFIGDGGIGFYGFELSTAVENRLALKVIIGNDRCWGVERRLQRAHYGRTVATDLPDIEYHALARALGANALLVDDPARLDDAVDRMVRSEGPFVLNIRIARDAGRPLTS